MYRHFKSGIYTSSYGDVTAKLTPCLLKPPCELVDLLFSTAIDRERVRARVYASVSSLALCGRERETEHFVDYTPLYIHTLFSTASRLIIPLLESLQPLLV